MRKNFSDSRNYILCHIKTTRVVWITVPKSPWKYHDCSVLLLISTLPLTIDPFKRLIKKVKSIALLMKRYKHLDVSYAYWQLYFVILFLADISVAELLVR